MGHDYPIEESRIVYKGFYDLVCDRVRMPDGGTADRIYLDHPGAAAVVALDAEGRVLLVRQYRVAVRERLWELPAGLCDVEGEDPVETARRELAEEADLVADSIEPLLVVHTTPGSSNERIHVYVARGLRPVDRVDYVRTHEESEIETRWWDLDEALAAIDSGVITNNVCVAGLLAAARSR